MNAVDMAE